jgi:glyoxylase-like metal-dependent hydrolase (beta-lactamase superfamily II)
MILDLPGTTGITMVRCAGTNCYLIETGDGVMVVDAGWWTGPDAIIRGLNEMGFQPKDVGLIVLTHAHFDHFSFAHELQKRTGGGLAAHRADISYFERGGIGVFPPRIANRIHKQKWLTENLLHAPGVSIDLVLEEGDLLEEWRVLHTPGHTPGSISLFAENRRVLITGGWAILGKPYDQNNPPGNPLVGYISTDPEALWVSRTRLAQLDYQTLLCSHFRPQMFNRFAKRLRTPTRD